MTQFFSLGALREKIESFWPNKLSQLSWDKNIWIKKKTFVVLVTQSVTRNLVLLLKLFNKQNTSKLLWYKLYFKIIWFSMWFWFSNHHFQNDFDFKSPLFRWFDFDFKIINISWFCPSLVTGISKWSRCCSKGTINIQNVIRCPLKRFQSRKLWKIRWSWSEEGLQIP